MKLTEYYWLICCVLMLGNSIYFQYFKINTGYAFIFAMLFLLCLEMFFKESEKRKNENIKCKTMKDWYIDEGIKQLKKVEK